ncbi:TolC family protein [Sulfurimonas sp. HSL3-7]|uniref:TolC family protein n=1 Tax=Sulfonitrofixus jiaomeiensis TaxID=3131938 RepID=UPI0031F98B2F
MKKLAAVLLIAGPLLGNELPLSEEKSELLKLKREKIQEDIERGKSAWVSPLTVSASIAKNKDATDGHSEVKNAGISLNQDIFRSGGIYYAVDQVKASGEASLLGVDIEEATYLKNIYTLKAQIERDKLKYEQSNLTLKNMDIDLFIIKAKYKVGSADISELNRATLDRDSARTDLIVIKNTLRNERYELKKFSGVANAEKIRLPEIPLISENTYLQDHLELLQYSALDRSDNAAWKVTRSTYLPKLTVNGTLGYSDYQGDIAEYSGDTYSYGAVLSMPLDINTRGTVASGKLQYLQTKTAEIDRKMELEQEYAMRVNTIADYEEKIGVAEEMIKMYDDLYNFTNNQYKAGFKSAYDLESLGNSVKIQKLEKEIQGYNIIIEKISLYFDTRQ